MTRSAAERRWSVVLAGGQGVRMQPFVERWLGDARPKQYCSFTGGKTMLEHTWERASAAASRERVVTVIDPAHRRYLGAPRPVEAPGLILAQPANRDTGPGVFLPLAHVLHRDPEALVAVFPADHFIHPMEGFLELMEEAFDLAATLPSQFVLLAARAERPEPDYGWIQPGTRLCGSRAMLVRGFREKPAEEEAEALHRRGSLVNTMIVVARATALWRVAWSAAPSMMARFEWLRRRLGTSEEERALAAVYEELTPVNFSRDVLERATDWSVALPLRDVAWCDWGRPERVLESLRLIGRDAPSAPAAC